MYKKTVLIFGVSSFIGSNIAESFCSDYRVVGTYFNSKVINKNFFTIKCDISNPSLVKGIINLAKPDIVIYCVGEKDIEICHNNQQRSDALNANGIFNVVNSLDAFNAKFFFFSSAMIYSGADKEHTEEDSPSNGTSSSSDTTKFSIDAVSHLNPDPSIPLTARELRAFEAKFSTMLELMNAEVSPDHLDNGQAQDEVIQCAVCPIACVRANYPSSSPRVHPCEHKDDHGVADAEQAEGNHGTSEHNYRHLPPLICK